jgi:hypothetical protein
MKFDFHGDDFCRGNSCKVNPPAEAMLLGTSLTAGSYLSFIIGFQDVARTSKPPFTKSR